MACGPVKFYCSDKLPNNKNRRSGSPTAARTPVFNFRARARWELPAYFYGFARYYSGVMKYVKKQEKPRRGEGCQSIRADGARRPGDRYGQPEPEHQSQREKRGPGPEYGSVAPAVDTHFEEITVHLLQDDRPSAYCARISEEPFFQESPFDMLYRLKGTRQSPQHHPEGDVFVHTMLVVDQAARRREDSREPKAFMWAALLHDIGKPSTTRNRKGKITSYDHDKAGAELAETFLSKLTDDTLFIQKVVRLVRWHMQILFVVNRLSFADLEGMLAETDVRELGLLGLCDRLGRKGADRVREEENIRVFLQRCKEYEKGR